MKPSNVYPMQRVQNIQSWLAKNGLDFLIILNPIDLYYLTGIKLSKGYFLLAKEQAWLLVDARYYEACKEVSTVPVLLNLAEDAVLVSLIKDLQVKNLGFDAETITYQEYVGLCSLLAPEKVSLQGLDQFMKRMRLVKDLAEIAVLKKAADLCSAGFDLVCSMLAAGVTELQLATELEIYWLRKGAQGPAFEPIIAFGAHSSRPHHRATNQMLKIDSPVLIDIGVVLDNYCSDMTRTVFFGKPDPLLEQVYATVEAAQKKALALCRPGQLTTDIDAAARQHIKNAGYEFSHGLGHGVGLEVHELPVLRNVSASATLLQENMVVTIEPGIYLEGIGGVRIEDTILITSQGYESFTKRPTVLKCFDPKQEAS